MDDDNFNDYANEYDEDLLDEEYDDVEFDEIINDPFTTTDLDIESLINRFSNVQTAIDTEEEELIMHNQDLGEEDILDGLVNSLNIDNIENVDNASSLITNSNLEGNQQSVNDEQNLINDVETHRFSVDYLIGQSRPISTNTGNYANESAFNLTSADQQDRMLNNSDLDQLIADPNRSSNLEQHARLDLSNESLDLIVDDEITDLNSSLLARSSGEDTLAKTGEPVSLCRLRRRAVKILASRISLEKQYYEERENELKLKLDNLQSRNEELENQLNQTDRPQKQLFLISTAFVVCSLISYFIQTFN